jgi:hypothetical protein
MRSEHPSARRATVLYSRAALAMTAYFVLSVILSLPPVASAASGIEQSSVGRIAVAFLLVTMFAVALMLWGAAIWYARTSPDVMFPRGLVLVLLFTNIVGALAYYWLVARRRASVRAALGAG